MARGGMRIGEVLEIKPSDVKDRKIILHNPKSSRDAEIVFIPQKIANRLNKYIRDKDIPSYEQIFKIKYAGARMVVKKAGTPIEIVSKVILRHSNLSTTQRYLGKISGTEAIRWIENLYG